MASDLVPIHIRALMDHLLDVSMDTLLLLSGIPTCQKENEYQ